MYMIKYLLKNIKLPFEIIDIIYSFVDTLTEIKIPQKYKFKRLISNDLNYAIDSCFVKYILKAEEKAFQIMLKQNAYHLIDNIHLYNLKLQI